MVGMSLRGESKAETDGSRELTRARLNPEILAAPLGVCNILKREESLMHAG
jgi:hypothetical protein